jgi:hypothetical protein
MIYLGSTYTHDDPAVQEWRFQAVCKAAAHFLKQGFHILSPIAHAHPIAQYGLPTDWGFWAEYDEACIKTCEVMWILMLDGWEISRGVNAEIQIAKSLSIPIKYVQIINPDSDQPEYHVRNTPYDYGRLSQ